MLVLLVYLQMMENLRTMIIIKKIIHMLAKMGCIELIIKYKFITLNK